MSKSAPHQSRRRVIIAVTVCLCLPAVFAIAQHGKPLAASAPARLGASAPPEIATPPAVANAPGKTSERLREGTRLADELGSFQGTADRIVFTPENGKDSYRVLENLALQRVVQTLEGARGQQGWIISGVITEFRGANYLLLTKTSQESRSSAKPGNAGNTKD